MALLLVIILWLLLVILLLVGLAVILPVLLRVQMSTSPHFSYRVEMRLWGGLAPRLTLAKGPRRRTGAKPAPKPAPKPAAPRKHRMPRLGRVHGSMAHAAPDLILGVLGCIHLQELTIDAEFGLGDPADTGRLCGLVMPLNHAAPLPASVSLHLRPDFTKTCLNGSLSAVMRLTLAALLVPIAGFAWRVYGPQR
jgi:hypothetical protein